MLSSGRVDHLGGPGIPVLCLGRREWWEGRSRASFCRGVSKAQSWLEGLRPVLGGDDGAWAEGPAYGPM